MRVLYKYFVLLLCCFVAVYVFACVTSLSRSAELSTKEPIDRVFSSSPRVSLSMPSSFNVKPNLCANRSLESPWPRRSHSAFKSPLSACRLLACVLMSDCQCNAYLRWSDDALNILSDFNAYILIVTQCTLESSYSIIIPQSLEVLVNLVSYRACP